MQNRLPTSSQRPRSEKELVSAKLSMAIKKLDEAVEILARAEKIEAASEARHVEAKQILDECANLLKTISKAAVAR